MLVELFLFYAKRIIGQQADASPVLVDFSIKTTNVSSLDFLTEIVFDIQIPSVRHAHLAIISNITSVSPLTQIALTSI